MTPKVSVIIPTYNRSHFIIRAIESVFKQTFTDYEILVIDDGSIDNTRQVLEPYLNRIKYIFQNNQGVSAARNRGIKESSGKYIAFLDSDDVWIPEKLSFQVPVLEKDLKVGIVYSKMTKINEKNEPCGTKPEGFIGKDFSELVEKGGDLPTSSVITRKECFDKAGLFDESFAIMEDFEMWLRISRYYEIVQVPSPNLVFYYCHGQQVTKNKMKVYTSTVELDKKILRSFDNIPKGIINKRLASNEYVLSREYYIQNKIPESFKHLTDAIGRNPFLGVSFIDQNDHLINKALKSVKPYVFLSICSVKYFFVNIFRK